MRSHYFRKRSFGPRQVVAPKMNRTYKGITFHSKKEMLRYIELEFLEHNGLIKELKIQVRFPIIVNGTKIATYVADFTYFDEKDKKIVEDSKGYKTEVYRMKSKLFKACYPELTFLET